MWNTLCSPEMSPGNSADKPHAYVAFDDDQNNKEVVPLTFISQFPSQWRSKGWNKDYLFKVFWSPDDEDTPQKMLSRAPEIPVYEKGAAFENSGYYRAAVVAVKETRAELEEFIESKRVSVGLLKFKYTSFDDPNKNVKKNVGKKTAVKDKKKGINRDANRDNLSDLRGCLQDQFQFLQDDDHESPDVKTNKKKIVDSKKKETKSTQASKGDEISSCSKLKCPLSAINTKKEKSDSSEEDYETPDEKVKFLELKEKETTATEGSKNETFSLVKPKRPLRATKGKKGEVSDSSEDEDFFMVKEKRMKLDPDFTPKKYMELKEDLNISQSSVKRMTSLNLKLQEQLTNAYEKIDKLEKENCHLRSELKQKASQPSKCQVCSQSKSAPGSKPSSAFTVKKLSSPELFKSLGTADPDKEEKSSNDFEGKFCSQSPSETESDSNTFLNSFEMPDMEEHEKSIDPNENNACLDPRELCSVSFGGANDSDGHDGAYKLTSNVEIRSEIWKIIASISPGEKRDLKYVKYLSIAAFGPEVLASSTILGTKKGGRKKKEEDSEEKKVKPALDKEVLRAIEEHLEKRVRSEEGDKINVNEHPRLLKKRLYDAIRDAQKRCRELGYGVGDKSNAVEKDMLS